MSDQRFTHPTREPILLIANVSGMQVGILGKLVLQPGEVAEVFSRVQPDVRQDLIIRAVRDLTPPEGQLYLDWKVNGVIQVLDFRIWAYSVDESLIRTTNAPTEGTVLGFVDGKLEWVPPTGISVNEPLQYGLDGKLTMPRASASADGYLTKEDYQYIFSSIRRKQRIWQYQDFVAPAGTSITLSQFQNGSGLAFDSSYIVNDTAEIVQTDNINKPPTSTVSFPGRLMPSARVEVSSHIGDTVILNQAPDASLGCRVYYLVSLPDGVPTPSDYQQAPMFLRNSPSLELDESYVNQAQEETIYGAKVYAGSTRFDSLIQITTAPSAGYVLTSDSSGFASWQPKGEAVDSYIKVQEIEPVDGYIWVKPSTGDAFIYNSAFDRWTAPAQYITYHGGILASAGIFLRAHTDVASSKTPALIAEAALLQSIEFISSSPASHTIEIFSNGVSAGTYSVSSGLITQIGVLVASGSTISVQVLSGESEYPIFRLKYRAAV